MKIDSSERLVSSAFCEDKKTQCENAMWKRNVKMQFESAMWKHNVKTQCENARVNDP